MKSIINIKLIAIIFAVFFLPILGSSQTVQKWANNYGVSTLNDYGNDIEKSANGNIVVCGYATLSGQTSKDVFITVYNSATGATITGWPKTKDYGSANDYALACLTDASNNIYVTGQAGTNGKMILIKYNSAGVFQWDNSTWAVAGEGRCIVSDGTNIYIAGNKTANGGDIYIEKYASTGGAPSATWQSNYSSDDAPYSMLYDATGSKIVVVGYKTITNNGKDMWLGRFNTNLSLVANFPVTWNNTSNDDIAYSVCMDAPGNLMCVVGSTYVNSTNLLDAFLNIYNSSGVNTASTTYNNSNNGDDVYYSIAHDNNTTLPNLYCGGYSYNGSTNGNDFLVNRYDNVCNQTSGFPQLYDRSNGDDRGFMIKFASSALGNISKVYISGKTSNSSTATDYTFLRYAIGGGTQEVATNYNRAGFADDEPIRYPLEVDEDGCCCSYNVYMTGGTTPSSGNPYDCGTVKYGNTCSCCYIAPGVTGGTCMIIYPDSFFSK
jgi:hypothetical protein